ncbi:hypothetical protein ABIA41_002699 [Bradyrhizobium sp. USDA 313]
MNDSIFVGLDVHKTTISVAVAEGMRGGEVRNLGIIPNRADQIAKLAKKLGMGDRQVNFCYEARTLRIWPASTTDGTGAQLHRGGTLADPDEGWGSGQDGPARCGDAGQAAPERRADSGVGSGCGA